MNKLIGCIYCDNEEKFVSKVPFFINWFGYEFCVVSLIFNDMGYSLFFI